MHNSHKTAALLQHKLRHRYRYRGLRRIRLTSYVWLNADQFKIYHFLPEQQKFQFLVSFAFSFISSLCVLQFLHYAEGDNKQMRLPWGRSSMLFSLSIRATITDDDLMTKMEHIQGDFFIDPPKKC